MKPMSTSHVSPVLQQSRRHFLKLSGLAAAAAGVSIACENDNVRIPDEMQLPGIRNGVFDFGGGDLGILTFAYALEQLEAEFATRVVTAAGFSTAFSAEDQQIFRDIYNHEVIHREFFRNILSSRVPDTQRNLLPSLEFNFAAVDFSSRAAVLNYARSLEDIGIAAYNGAAKLIQEENLLTIAGKIVSVEARHASAIRMLLDPGAASNFPSELDPAWLPSQVLQAIDDLGVIITPVSANYLP